MNKSEIAAVLNQLSYKENTTFLLIEKGEDVLFLQVVTRDVCVDTGNYCYVKGRKFYLSEHMIESEIVQTGLMAVLAFEEHEARENFKYKGKRLFGPHIDVNSLAGASDTIVGRPIC